VRTESPVGATLRGCPVGVRTPPGQPRRVAPTYRHVDTALPILAGLMQSRASTRSYRAGEPGPAHCWLRPGVASGSQFPKLRDAHHNCWFVCDFASALPILGKGVDELVVLC